MARLTPVWVRCRWLIVGFVIGLLGPWLFHAGLVEWAMRQR
jgi:hypothetical protein